MHLITFLKGKQIYFYIILILYILIIFSLFLIILILSFKLKSNKSKLSWLIYILKYSLPVIFITFFGQTFFFYYLYLNVKMESHIMMKINLVEKMFGL